jgi:hypothetical protein
VRHREETSVYTVARAIHGRCSRPGRSRSQVLKHLSDGDLIAEVNRLASPERAAIANLVVALGEMDARRLYLGQGCSSMFTYCTQLLHLAEHVAFNRNRGSAVGHLVALGIKK